MIVNFAKQHKHTYDIKIGSYVCVNQSKAGISSGFEITNKPVYVVLKEHGSNEDYFNFHFKFYKQYFDKIKNLKNIKRTIIYYTIRDIHTHEIIPYVHKNKLIPIIKQPIIINNELTNVFSNSLNHSKNISTDNIVELEAIYNKTIKNLDL